MGGKYEPGNVIAVEITACNTTTANHVMWHYANWLLHGKWEDQIAYKGLAGFYNKEEIIAKRNKLNGITQGAKNKDSGHTREIGKKYGALAMSEGGWLYENRVEYGALGYIAGIGKPENRLSSEELSVLAKKTYAEGKGLASITSEERVEINKRAGKVSGQLHKERGTGVCGIPPEEHSERMANTNRQKWKCPKCDYENIARHVNNHMSEEHNLPKSFKLKMVTG
jgi:dissimilatory sulfite reductase (desulfoviridin) alpha/beta subunit